MRSNPMIFRLLCVRVYVSLCMHSSQAQLESEAPQQSTDRTLISPKDDTLRATCDDNNTSGTAQKTRKHAETDAENLPLEPAATATTGGGGIEAESGCVEAVAPVRAAETSHERKLFLHPVAAQLICFAGNGRGRNAGKASGGDQDMGGWEVLEAVLQSEREERLSMGEGWELIEAILGSCVDVGTRAQIRMMVFAVSHGTRTCRAVCKTHPICNWPLLHPCTLASLRFTRMHSHSRWSSRTLAHTGPRALFAISLLLPLPTPQFPSLWEEQTNVGSSDSTARKGVGSEGAHSSADGSGTGLARCWALLGDAWRRMYRQQRQHEKEVRSACSASYRCRHSSMLYWFPGLLLFEYALLVYCFTG